MFCIKLMVSDRHRNVREQVEYTLGGGIKFFSVTIQGRGTYIGYKHKWYF